MQSHLFSQRSNQFAPRICGQRMAKAHVIGSLITSRATQADIALVVHCPSSAQQFPMQWPSGHIECARIQQQIAVPLSSIDLSQIGKSHIVTNANADSDILVVIHRYVK